MIVFFYVDCQDLYADGFSINGVYKVYLPKSNASFDVYCEFQNKIGIHFFYN